jgi:RNA polymerase sigma-70 factor (ECF subfamily)
LEQALELMAMLRARDPAAVEKAMEIYSDTIRSVAGSFLDDKRDVEECVNDTFLKLWNSPPDDASALYPYIISIARRTALNSLRDRRRGKKRRGQLDSPISELERIASHLDDPFSAARANELKELIRDFVLSQPPERQQIFILRYWYQREVPEIADRLGITSNNVRVQLHRMREELKIKLKEKEFYV